MDEVDKLRNDTVEEFANLRKALREELNSLKKENTKLKEENIGLINLLNNHAGLINKNTKAVKDLDKNLRSEITRITIAFKNVKNSINKKG